MAIRPRVLIVEDEPDVRALLRCAMSQAFEVDEASDGEEALRQVAAHRYDLVLVDIELPGRSGYDVCAAIRALPAGRDVQVVLCVTRGGLGNQLRGQDGASESDVARPFIPGALMARVQPVVAQSSLVLN